MLFVFSGIFVQITLAHQSHNIDNVFRLRAGAEQPYRAKNIYTSIIMRAGISALLFFPSILLL